MKKNNSFKRVFTLLLILTIVAYFGCEKKTEENSDKEDHPKTEIKTPDISGNWSGTFDGKSTVLDITEQTDSNFSGKITISYRQVINQDVKGSFSPTTLKMTMKDQLHSRFQGVYNGSLSKEADNFSGTFTMDQDGSKYSFNLSKK
jgi:hypothetical protein